MFIYPQVAGKLHIEISKLGGAVLDRYIDMASDSDDDSPVPMGAPLLVRVSFVSWPNKYQNVSRHDS